MHRTHEWLFVLTVLEQCEYAEIAYPAINEGLDSVAHKVGTEFNIIPITALYHFHGLILAAARVARILWPNTDPAARPQMSPEERESLIARGKALRKTLHVRGNPAYQRSAIRNALEHFDERLEQWDPDGDVNLADALIFPDEHCDGTPIEGRLRGFIWSTREFIFHGDRIPIDKLYQDLELLRERCSQWIREWRR